MDPRGCDCSYCTGEGPRPGDPPTLEIGDAAPACPHCEYDSRFPEFEAGGWLQQDNNGPIVPCPVCNPNGERPRS